MSAPCMVTLRHLALGKEWDLELPTHVPVADLVGLLASGLRWAPPQGLVLCVEPHRRVLRDDETLHDADVADGSCLVLCRPDEAVSSLVSAPAEVLDGGVRADARPLFPNEDQRASGGFVWKQID